MGEPGRRKSYSEGLRWRIVYQKHLMGLNYREISQNLMVSVSTVARIVDRLEHTGEVTRSVKPATERLLHEHNVFVLMQIVLERPSVYLHELQQALTQTTGMFVSEAAICRTLKRFGIFLKKVKYTALQRSNLIRAEYQAEIAIYDSSMLVFVDESGTDQRNAMYTTLWICFKRLQSTIFQVP